MNLSCRLAAAALGLFIATTPIYATETAVRTAGGAPPSAKGLAAITPPSIGGPTSMFAGHFRLSAPDGRIVDSDRLASPYALFFGFTHCADFCPTTLAEASAALKRMPARANNLKFYFISVDPERDTPAVLGQYMESFDPRIVPLTGPRPAVNEAIRSFGVIARRTDYPNGDYTYGHSAAVFLVDENGLIVDRVVAGKGADSLARKLASLIPQTSVTLGRSANPPAPASGIGKRP